MSDSDPGTDSAPRSAPDDPDTITVYADYVCPFCFLGRQSLDQYRETRSDPLAIDWRPFDLRASKRRSDGSIDHSVEDGKDDEYFEQARENVRRLQEEYGVEMTEELRRDVDSLPAQVVSYYLKEHRPDRWPAFDDAVYDALWVEGRDIEDRNVLRDLAEEAEVEPGIVGEILDDGSLREELRDRFDDARQSGVTGVPTFVYGDHAARGAVPPEHLRRLVEEE